MMVFSSTIFIIILWRALSNHANDGCKNVSHKKKMNSDYFKTLKNESKILFQAPR